MEHPTTGRHRRPCHSMAGRMWALTAALLAATLAALFSPRPTRPARVPRALPAASTPKSVSGRDRRGGDLLAEPPGFPEQHTWAVKASSASARWRQAYRDHSAPFEPKDRVDNDPDQIAGALVRPYLGAAVIPRPRPAEPEDYPAVPPVAGPEPAEDEFAELTDRIRAYLAQRA